MIFRALPLLFFVGITSQTLLASSRNHGDEQPFWTLDHGHDIRHAVKKMKQEGFIVYNDTSDAEAITLVGQLEGGTKEPITQVIPPRGSVTFPSELTYTDMMQSGSSHAFPNLMSRYDSTREKKIYDIHLSRTPMPFEQFGRSGFGFDFNFLKHAPLHRTSHQIHPMYLSEDGMVNPNFLLNELYYAMKKAQEALEKAETLEAKAKAAREVKNTHDDWQNWLSDYFKEGSEERRAFLEDDELLYLSHVIRPYDPTVGPRREKKYGALLQAKKAFDEAVEEKEEAFAKLAEAKLDWRKWAAQYNGNVWFLQHRILQSAHVSLSDYQILLNKQYKDHNPGQMFGHLKHHPVSMTHRKIPANTQTLWFTHPENPREFPYVSSLKRSSLVCPQEQGFSHYLWVLDKRIMPLTMEALDQRLHQTPEYGFGAPIIVKEFSEFGDFHLKDFVEDSVYKKRKMGMATDAFRAVLLEKFGGIYMDSDFEMLQSVSPWLNYYDGVFTVEPMSSFVGNAHFMVAPHHPVMTELVNIITRNTTAETIPSYIHDVLIEDPVYATIAITGPGALTEAVAKKIGSHHSHDVVLPHPFFYPSVNNIYPELSVQKSTQGLANKFDATAWSVHKWHTAWDKVEFGSVG